jgi:AcrR family transcriptional regulator
MLRDGLDAVTPETVSATVDVSSRTFRNYFSTVEEAILDELMQWYLTLADQIRARPAAEPIWDSLLQVLPTAVTPLLGERDDIAVLVHAVEDSPGIMAQVLVLFERGRQRLAQVISERTGADLLRDPAPQLLAGAATTAMSTATTMWARRTAELPLPDLIRANLEQLRAGIPLDVVTSAD